MKKTILLVLFSFLCMTTYSQKKKKSSKSKPVSTSSALATADNVTVEIIKDKFFLFKNVSKTQKDTISKKIVESKSIPTDCKLESFVTKTKKLYYLSWIEKTTNLSTNKTEEITQTTSQVFDMESKQKLFENIQKSTKISEKVFLDRLKNASETQEKMRNEGYIFTKTKDGDILLNSKTKEIKMTFDLAKNQYIAKK
jgi:hypothetical protein